MKYCTDREAKDALIAIGHQLYQQGLIVGTDGNLSCRVTRDTLWTTATGARKGFLTDEWLVKTDLEGNLLEGTRKPSSELKMHLCLYKANPRALAAVHTHPPFSTAFAAANLGFDKMLLAEEGLYLGHVQAGALRQPRLHGAGREYPALLPEQQRRTAGQPRGGDLGQRSVRSLRSDGEPWSAPPASATTA